MNLEEHIQIIRIVDQILIRLDNEAENVTQELRLIGPSQRLFYRSKQLLYDYLKMHTMAKIIALDSHQSSVAQDKINKTTAIIDHVNQHTSPHTIENED